MADLDRPSPSCQPHSGAWCLEDAGVEDSDATPPFSLLPWVEVKVNVKRDGWCPAWLLEEKWAHHLVSSALVPMREGGSSSTKA